MHPSLLATKLQIPPQGPQTVLRPRLSDTLERGVRDDACKLILLSAPAGYGKTTLLAQWARMTEDRVTWLSLDHEDNDPDRFWRSLFAAWEVVRPDIGESPLGLLLNAIAPDRDAVLAAFISLAGDLAERTAFVLDDAHLIEDPEVQQSLHVLLDHLPPAHTFVLAGRTDSPLPLARYRARQQLLDLGGDDLQFLLEEAAEFLTTRMRLALTADEVASLHAQVEGWITGLHLAALTLRRHREARPPPAVSGRHRFIADYLREDILCHLPVETQQFLLRTSILDHLCAPLCDAVTGEQQGQEMLERLERENLFLVPLDDTREWFRYHRLFADFLRDESSRRQPGEVAHLHRRAAEWYLAKDLPDPAFDHAVAADDLDLTIRIFERYANARLQGGELRMVQHWLDALPPAWLAAYPVFDLARAGLLAFSGALDACQRCIDDVEQRLASAQGGDARQQQAKATAIRCAIACMQSDLGQARAYAEQALGDLPEDDLGFRPLIYGALGDSYRQRGYWNEAKTCYLQALDFRHAPTIRVESAHVFGALADLDLRQGHLKAAAANWDRALAAIQDRRNWGLIPLPVIGWVHLRLGELYYEGNDLERARAALARGLEYAELGGDVRALIAGYLLASRLELAEGGTTTAGEHLERARPFVEQAQFPDWTSRFERCQLDLWLMAGRLRAALAWADAALASEALPARPESESARLALARLLIVKGDASARRQAAVLLAQLLQAAEAEGRMGIQIEALALRAMVCWQDGDRAGAMTALDRALRLAEPEGYVRLFADLGPAMAPLLQEARRRDVMPVYAAQLLAAGGHALDSSSPGELLVDPLSAREREVLTLLAVGLTNREIAGQLFISPQTVKKHTGNIYAKLNADNRTQAVARARELRILDDAH
jgi:LuxR family maltose regulon positive regulatory protein